MKTININGWTKAVAATSLLALLAGCGGGSAGLHYYNLPNSQQQSSNYIKSAGATRNPVAISISPVQLSSFLDGTGIVYQLSPVEFNEAQLNLWANDISDQLTSTLANTLQQGAGAYNVLPEGADTSKADHLNVQLDRFQGRYDGMAIVHGSYQLFDPDQHLILQGPINQTVGLTRDGYPALVTALSKAWQQAGDSLSDRLSSHFREQATRQQADTYSLSSTGKQSSKTNGK